MTNQPTKHNPAKLAAPLAALVARMLAARTIAN